MPLKVKNIAAGYYGPDGKFHPIRASKDYGPSLVDEPYAYKKVSKKEREAKAKRAEEIARAARAAWKAAKKASKKKAAKPAAKKAAKKAAARGAAKLAARAAKKKNPIPTTRWVPAKIRRTKSGDIKVILPLK